MTTSMRANHYEVLGVAEAASPEQLKAAYRARVKELHPDSGGTDEEFEALQVAWSVLSDSARRRDYDSWLDDIRPVMGGARLAVQQRYEERELEVERRAWDARREEARKAAAAATAQRRAEQAARREELVARTDVRRHLVLGLSSIATLVSALELVRGSSGYARDVMVLGADLSLPPTTITVLVIQMVVGLVVAVAAIVMRAPVESEGPRGERNEGPASFAGSSLFRMVVGLTSALLALWVLVPFLLRAL